MTTTRRDGRSTTDIRPLKFSYDGLARVDGSARFAFGDDTSVLASVSGPIEVRLAAELPSKATFEVIVRPLANVPATDARLVGANIKSTLEPALLLSKSPRTMVQLVIQALTSPRTPLWRDTLTAAMINSSTLAFLHAGSVAMQGVVAAVAVGRLPDGTLILDPSEEETESLQAGGSFAFMFSDTPGAQKLRVDCVWSNWKSSAGGASSNELFEARNLGKIGAMQVYDAIRKYLETRGGATETRVPVSEVIEIDVDQESTSDDEKMEI